MKRLLNIGLLLLLIIILCGCSSNNETQEDTKSSKSKNNSKAQVEQAVETLDLGQTAEYTFGSFTISAFKRDGDKLYFSVQIDPRNNGTNRLELDEISYYFNNTSNRIPEEIVNLSSDQFQNVYTIASKKVAEIDAISLKYNDVKTKWKLNLDSDSDGDVSYIDTTLSQNLEQQALEELQQQVQPQNTQTDNITTLVDEQHDTVTSQIVHSEDINQAWPVLNQYGKEAYPDGFELNYTTNKMIEERRPEGTWLLRAGCTLTSMEGDKIDAICQAVVEYYDGHWDILSFEVY